MKAHVLSHDDSIDVIEKIESETCELEVMIDIVIVMLFVSRVHVFDRRRSFVEFVKMRIHDDMT